MKPTIGFLVLILICPFLYAFEAGDTIDKDPGQRPFVLGRTEVATYKYDSGIDTEGTSFADTDNRVHKIKYARIYEADEPTWDDWREQRYSEQRYVIVYAQYKHSARELIFGDGLITSNFITVCREEASGNLKDCLEDNKSLCEVHNYFIREHDHLLKKECQSKEAEGVPATEETKPTS